MNSVTPQFDELQTPDSHAVDIAQAHPSFSRVF